MNPDLTPLEFFKYLVFENGVEDEMSKFLIYPPDSNLDMLLFSKLHLAAKSC